MQSEEKFTEEEIDIVASLVSMNREFDFIKADLNQQGLLETLGYQGDLSEENVLSLLKTYQRLVRLVPEGKIDVTISMMKAGMDTAVQIANMSKWAFIAVCGDLFTDNTELAAVIYENAKCKRAQVLLEYMNILQNNEPHVNAAMI